VRLSADDLGKSHYLISKKFAGGASDLEGYLLLARTAFDAAVASGVLDPETGLAYRSVAMMIAYNIAAACWPGWETPSPGLTEAHQATALEYCRFNVATELQVLSGRHMNGDWITGAHLMAAGSYDDAERRLGRQCGSRAKPTSKMRP
jgi:hypothetical protein